MRRAFRSLGHTPSVSSIDLSRNIQLTSAPTEKDNKYLDPSQSRSSLQEAKDLLARNGSLSEAALLLEAAIQNSDLGEGGYEAWILLGETRSMDERDDVAMPALMEGIKRAEAAGAAGAGMLVRSSRSELYPSRLFLSGLQSLAIAFTNESFERASHTMLLRWLSARFPDAGISQEAWQSLSNSSWHSQEQVTEAYLKIAREQYARGEVDADVQIGLGVLFYTSGEFARAKDCFEAALSMRPKVRLPGSPSFHSETDFGDDIHSSLFRITCSGIGWVPHYRTETSRKKR